MLTLALAVGAVPLNPGRAYAVPDGTYHYKGTFSGSATGTSINGLFFDRPPGTGNFVQFSNAPITGTIDYDATRITTTLRGGTVYSYVVTQDFSMSYTINGRTVASSATSTDIPTVSYTQGGFQSIYFSATPAAPVEGNMFLQLRANVPFLVDGTTMQEISLNRSQLDPNSGSNDFLPRLNANDPGGYFTIALNSFELHAVSTPSTVPEPASMMMLGVGIVAAAWRVKRC